MCFWSRRGRSSWWEENQEREGEDTPSIDWEVSSFEDRNIPSSSHTSSVHPSHKPPSTIDWSLIFDHFLPSIPCTHLRILLIREYSQSYTRLSHWRWTVPRSASFAPAVSQIWQDDVSETSHNTVHQIYRTILRLRAGGFGGGRAISERRLATVYEWRKWDEWMENERGRENPPCLPLISMLHLQANSIFCISIQ